MPETGIRGRDICRVVEENGVCDERITSTPNWLFALAMASIAAFILMIIPSILLAFPSYYVLYQVALGENSGLSTIHRALTLIIIGGIFFMLRLFYAIFRGLEGCDVRRGRDLVLVLESFFKKYGLRISYVMLIETPLILLFFATSRLMFELAEIDPRQGLMEVLGYLGISTGGSGGQLLLSKLFLVALSVVVFADDAILLYYAHHHGRLYCAYSGARRRCERTCMASREASLPHGTALVDCCVAGAVGAVVGFECDKTVTTCISIDPRLVRNRFIRVIEHVIPGHTRTCKKTLMSEVMEEYRKEVGELPGLRAPLEVRERKPSALASLACKSTGLLPLIDLVIIILSALF